MIKVASVLLTLFIILMFLGGCADPQKVGVALVDDTPCEIMGQHMPQKVWLADTYATKVEALHRNAAYEVACPSKANGSKGATSP